MMKSLSQDRAAFLGIVARRIVPEIDELETSAWSRFYAIVDQALMDRPATVRRQFGVFLGLIRWLPLARYGTSFERLTDARRDAVLRWLQRALVGRLRQGFWGLKTLVFMGYYGQQELWDRVGYAPANDGNMRLDGAA